MDAPAVEDWKDPEIGYLVTTDPSKVNFEAARFPLKPFALGERHHHGERAQGHLPQPPLLADLSGGGVRRLRSVCDRLHMHRIYGGRVRGTCTWKEGTLQVSCGVHVEVREGVQRARVLARHSSCSWARPSFFFFFFFFSFLLPLFLSLSFLSFPLFSFLSPLSLLFSSRSQSVSV